ncbi:MAG: hypothetical protein AB7D05_10515, partial [Mangrovibacterium sp.]
FYNIQVSPPFAIKHNIEAHPAIPTPLLKEYTHYALSRYFKTFPSVGLYACPGESLLSKYQLEWFRDVIFDAAKKSGKDPLIVIRDWTLNRDLQDQLKVLYKNCYSELKHNDESVSSPYPDVRNMKWEGVTAGHIINAAHGPAEDLKPIRWADHLYIKEMAQHWKSLGFVRGIEFWGQSFWDWPYTYDKVTPRLKYIDRDAPFYKAIGRYMWNADRDNEKEHVFWIDYYTNRFESKEIGRLIARWYEVSGPIGPGLLNLNATRVANWWSAVTLMNQSVDQILNYNKSLDETPYTLYRETGRAEQRYYPRPFDEYFFKRYQNKYNMPVTGKNPKMFKEFYPYAQRIQVENLAQRKCMPVSQYARYLVKNENVESALTPDKVIPLLTELADEALTLARKADSIAVKSPYRSEIHRFVIDSEILKLATETMTTKEEAVIMKACMLLENDFSKQKTDEFIEKMEESVDRYKKLYHLGQASYIKASFMMDWSKGLNEFKDDLKKQQEWIDDIQK